MKKRKGIILAGGSGTRLYPSTKVISKQLLAVYDKPMIYYPLSTLMLAQINEILFISTPNDLPNFKKLFGNGSEFGLKLEYAEQPSPDGLAQALIIAEDFLDGSSSALILGDNIFVGEGITKLLLSANTNHSSASIFTYHVNDPHRYGIAEFDKNLKVISLEEKPKIPKSNYAITGLYFYDKYAPKYAKSLKPSKRGELEITDLNKVYLKKNKLETKIINREDTWLDTGTFDSLLEASQVIHAKQTRQGLKIGCIEEIAYNNNWISENEIKKASKNMSNNSYGTYLKQIVNKLNK